MRAKHVLVVPAVIWGLIASAFLLDPVLAMDNFTVLWFLNDIAIALLILALLLHFLKASAPGPKVDEWTGWDPKDPFAPQRRGPDPP